MLATLIVDTAWDDPFATATDTDGLVSLREAILAANQNSAFGDAAAGESGVVDRIRFAESLSGTTIELQGEELAIDDDLVLEGLGRDVLAISGQDNSRVLSIAPETDVEVMNIAIIHGRADSGGGVANSGTLTIRDSALRSNTGGEGGAIYNDGTLAVIGTMIEANAADDYGGGIENYGTVTIRDSQIRDNSAGYGGGAIDHDGDTLTIQFSSLSGNSANDGGAISNWGSLTVSDSIFEQNEAANSGGAVYNAYSQVTLVDSVVTGNRAARDGGGIYSSEFSEATLVNAFVAGNLAVGDGGGIYTANSSLTITASRVEGNSAGDGGAIHNLNGSVAIEASSFFENSASYGGAIDTTAPSGSSVVTIEASTFAGNHAAYGGAVNSIDTDLQINNSTFSGNVALKDGGAIRNWGPLQISHSTITGNRADADGNDALPEGGGLFNSHSYQPRGTIDNTIIAGNFQGTGSQPNDIGGPLNASSSHNLIGDAVTAGGLVDSVNGNIVGNAGIGTIEITAVLDPELADNGGPTWTHALMAGSPAIDAADSTLQYDQRGSQRMLDGNDDGIFASDIGAYERVTLGSVMTPLEQQIRSLRDQGVISSGDQQSLLNFLERTRFHVGRGQLDQAQHFLELFIDKIQRLADSGKLPSANANGLSGYARTIQQQIQIAAEQHRTLDALFADFVFDWNWPV